MLLEFIRQMYAYNTWANQRLFDALASLSDADFVAPADASFGAIRATLVHLVSAQRVWLSRMQNGSTPPALQPEDFRSVEELRRCWLALERATQTFLDSLSEERLAALQSYINAQGEQNSYRLSEMLYHQANHAMQHRSEIAMVLTRLGASPGWLDVLYYLDWRRQA